MIHREHNKSVTWKKPWNSAVYVPQGLSKWSTAVWLKSSFLSPTEKEKQRIYPSYFRVLQLKGKAVKYLIPVFLYFMAAIKRAQVKKTRYLTSQKDILTLAHTYLLHHFLGFVLVWKPFNKIFDMLP